MTRSPKAQTLPKAKRNPKAVTFVITNRDLEILNALGRYRYLRTGQISKLVFPDNQSVQSARRRLKYLYHAGYVGRIQPLMQTGHGDGEMAYYLDKAGRALLDEDSLPNYSLKNEVKPLFLRHALDVSEFRLNLELAVQALPKIALHRVISDFELKSHTEKAIGKRKYRLFDEVVDPIGKRKITVHPDLMFIVTAEGNNDQKFSRLYFVEVDRGTEGLRVISDKLTGYHLYKRENVFKKFGKFDDFRVLIQTNSAKRAANIQTHASAFEDVMDIWTTHDDVVSENSILLELIWVTSQKRSVSIVKP